MSAHRAKKRFGQNFLVDKSVIERIVDSINPQAEDNIIEIGPGLGALTKPLLEKVNELHVIELDRDIIPRLVKNCSTDGNLIVHETDVLKFNFAKHFEAMKTENLLRIAGNLPYNISTAVLFLLLGNRNIIKDMHFMLQKEVVERICAMPGNRTYGRLSVMIQAYCKVSPLFTVPASAFTPAPKVESAILRLEPNDMYSKDIKNPGVFEDLVKHAFSHRRKTLANTLKNICSSDQIRQANIDPGQRAEQLSVQNYIKLYQQIP